MKTDVYYRAQTFLNANEDKLSRIERYADKIQNEEIKFQLQVAILNHYRDEDEHARYSQQQ